MHTQQSIEPEAVAPPAWRRAARRLVGGSLAAVLLASGLSALGTAQAASAADYTIGAGTLDTPGSPIKSMILNAGAKAQIWSSTYGYAFYGGSNPSSWTGVWSDSGWIESRNGTAAKQTFGGTGTPAAPLWLRTTNTIADDGQFTTTMSYVIGTDYVRNDVSFTNTREATRALQLTAFADCYFSGSDRGRSAIVAGSTAQCVSSTGARISYVAATPGAAVLGGEQYGIQLSGLRKQFVGTPRANTCVDETGATASCDTFVDNGMAMAWMQDVAPGGSISASYFSAYSASLKLADLSTDLQVSSSSATVGDTVDYTIMARNDGPQGADGAAATFTLPDGMRFVSAQGGTYDAATGVWSIGTLANGASTSLVVTARAMRPGTLDASVTSTSSNYIDVTPCVTGSALNCSRPVSVTVADGPSPSASAITASAATVPADGTPSTITVTTKNGLGETIYDPAADIALSTTHGTLSAVTDNGDGTYTAALTAAAAGTATVSFTVNGATSPNTASVDITALQGSSSLSRLSVTSAPALANGTDTQTASVWVLDARGTAVSGATVDFTVEGDASLSAPSAVSDASGVARVFVTSRTPGSYAVHASLGAVEVTDSPRQATFTVGAPNAASSTFGVSAGTKTADGSDTHTLTATVKDAQGHPITGATVTFGAPAAATLAATTAVTGADGVASTTVTSTKAGTYAVTARLGASPIAGSPKNIAFVAGAVDASTSSLAVSTGSVTADGVATHKATVTATDAQGNPVAGAPVDFTIPAGTTASASSAVTGADGTASITLTSESAGTYSVGASIGGTAVKSSPADVVFAAGAADASRSSWTVTPDGPVTADGSQKFTATATVRDAKGNPASGAVIAFEVAPEGVGISPASSRTCTTGADGTCTVTFTSTAAGSYTATAALGGDRIGTAKTLVFVAGAASAGTSAIVASAPSVRADGTPTVVTVRLLDADGNPLTSSGGTVVIITDLGSITATTDNGDGTYTAELSSTTVGNASLSFTLDGSSASKTTTVEFTDATPPDAPIIEPSDGVRVTGHAEPGSTVKVVDAAGTVIASGVADEDGWFSILLPSDGSVAHGAELTITATDEAGNESTTTSVTVDREAPEAPTVAPTQGGTVTGVAEPGSLVTVKDAEGHPIGTAQADADGRFTITLSPAATDGAELVVTATDPAGNESGATRSIVDATAPEAPLIHPGNGTSVTGTAEAGSTVTITDGDGNLLGTTVVRPDGTFEFIPTSPFADGTTLVLTVTDPAGNVSGSGTTVIDGVSPEAPLLDPSNGATVTGTAEAGSTVTVTDADGNVLGTAVVDPDGTFVFTPTTAIPDGTSLLVTVTDASGNVSATTPITVDSSAPDAPTVFPSNGSTVSGTAEAGTTVTVYAEDGTVLGTAVAGADSTFTLTLTPAAQTGDKLTAIATDRTGNESARTDVPVNSDVPTSPVLNPTGGASLSGTAEPFAEITIRDADGTVVATGKTLEDGSFAITIDPAAPHGAELSVTATNEVGTDSLVSTISVDAHAPEAPQVDATAGGIVTGTAEPGSTVTVTDAAGTVIGTGTVDENGRYTVELTPGLPEGGTATVTVTDPAGNESQPTEITADRTAPEAPAVDATQGGTVTGTAEPGSTITVTDQNGTVIGIGTAHPDGSFEVTLEPGLGDGETAIVTVTDPAGNTSPGTGITADRAAPDAPVVGPTQGDTLTGTAEPGSTVTVTDRNGVVIGTGTANADGRFTIELDPALADGATATVTATDPSGNASKPTEITADSSAPAAPSVDASNGKTITGTAEPGSTVTVTDQDGNVIGTGVARPDGTFTVTPTVPLPDGTVLTVTATDVSGNASAPSRIVIDGVAPAAPVIDATDGTTVTGSAEPGSTVVVRDADGTVLGTAVVGQDGRFSITLDAALAPGTTLSVTAVDAAGNESAATRVTVEKSATGTTGAATAPSGGLASGGLASTGADILQPILWSLLLLAAGTLLIALRLRRRREDEEAQQ